MSLSALLRQDPPKLLVAVAMRKETECLLPYAEHYTRLCSEPFPYYRCTVAGQNIDIAECGIGKSNAAAAVAYCLALAPEVQAVLNVGVSGGLAPQARVGDLLLGERYLYHDVWCGTGNAPGQVQGLPPFFPADERLMQAVFGAEPTPLNAPSPTATHTPPEEGQIRSGSKKHLVRIKSSLDPDQKNISSAPNLSPSADPLPAEETGLCLPPVCGDFCTGDRFIPDPSALKRLLEQYPRCISVDMESAAMAQICFRLGVPFLSVRVVSDTPLSAHNHTLQYQNFWLHRPDRAFAFFPALVSHLYSTLSV